MCLPATASTCDVTTIHGPPSFTAGMGGLGSMGSMGSMSGLLQANGLGHAALGMGLPSGLAGSKHGLGSHDGGSSDNLLSSESGERMAAASLAGTCHAGKNWRLWAPMPASSCCDGLCGQLRMCMLLLSPPNGHPPGAQPAYAPPRPPGGRWPCRPGAPAHQHAVQPRNRRAPHGGRRPAPRPAQLWQHGQPAGNAGGRVYGQCMWACCPCRLATAAAPLRPPRAAPLTAFAVDVGAAGGAVAHHQHACAHTRTALTCSSLSAPRTCTRPGPAPRAPAPSPAPRAPAVHL